MSPQSGRHAIDSERAGPKGLDLVRPAHGPARPRVQRVGQPPAVGLGDEHELVLHVGGRLDHPLEPPARPLDERAGVLLGVEGLLHGLVDGVVPEVDGPPDRGGHLAGDCVDEAEPGRAQPVQEQRVDDPARRLHVAPEDLQHRHVVGRVQVGEHRVQADEVERLLGDRELGVRGHGWTVGVVALVAERDGVELEPLVGDVGLEELDHRTVHVHPDVATDGEVVVEDAPG